VKAKLIGLTTGVIFLAIGVICLFFPQKIQEYTINIYSDGKGLAKYNPFIEWIKTPQYIFSIRIAGILALLACGFVFYALLFGK